MSVPRKPPIEDDSSGEPKFRLTSITLRANRAIAPFVHVRAEVSVTILKGGNKDDAREFAARECHAAISRLASMERSPSNVLDPITDALPGVPGPLDPVDEPNPF